MDCCLWSPILGCIVVNSSRRRRAYHTKNTMFSAHKVTTVLLDVKTKGAKNTHCSVFQLVSPGSRELPSLIDFLAIAVVTFLNFEATIENIGFGRLKKSIDPL